MTPLWFVYHVPKTGGQSIRDHLAAQLSHGVDYVHLGKWDRAAALTEADIEAMSEVERTKVRALSGHPVRRSFARHFPDRPLREIAILREPAARIVSHYNFNQTMRDRRGEPVIGFEEFLDGLPTNHMTTLLAKCFGIDRPRRHLDDVLHELGRLWLVGRTENLDELLPLLLEGMGLRPDRLGRSNVTGVTIDRRLELTPDLAAELRRRNPTDVKLYAALERLERSSIERLAAAGTA